MKRKSLTPEEKEAQIAEKEARKVWQKKINKIANSVKSKCGSEVGPKAMEYQLEFLSKNTTELPDPSLSREDNIKAFKAGISRYYESLGDFSKTGA